MENIAISLMNTLEAWHIPHQLITTIISMIPLIELRGSILVGGTLNLPFIQTFIASVIGNMLPIPFILLFIDKIFKWMKSVKRLSKIPTWIEERAMKKSEQIEKYGYWGLLLFVGIPLPGTGAWTGSLLAVLFGLEKKKSLFCIFLGVLLAGFIMSLVGYGVLNTLLYHNHQ